VLALSHPILQIPSIEQYAMRAFASALDAVPLALAENSGLPPIETLAEIRSRQITEHDSKLGIDCNGRGENGASTFRVHETCELTIRADMKKQFVYDPLISKRQQYLLATQVWRPFSALCSC
jgi:T-complex protein 1 subunit epsilon